MPNAVFSSLRHNQTFYCLCLQQFIDLKVLLPNHFSLLDEEKINSLHSQKNYNWVNVHESFNINLDESLLVLSLKMCTEHTCQIYGSRFWQWIKIINFYLNIFLSHNSDVFLRTVRIKIRSARKIVGNETSEKLCSYSEFWLFFLTILSLNFATDFFHQRFKFWFFSPF